MNWNKAFKDIQNNVNKAKEVFAPIDNLRKPPMCDGCGMNRSDPPSKLCPGCQAVSIKLK